MRLGFAVLAATFVLGAATANATPDADIKFRKGVMANVGAMTGGVAAAMKGDVDPKLMAAITRSLAGSAGMAIDAFRPNTAGQGSEKTTVKGDTVWANWADYSKRMGEFSAAANALAKAGAGTDQKAIGAAFKAFVGTCKGCHENYRQ
jgi:cytochrome c556